MRKISNKKRGDEDYVEKKGALVQNEIRTIQVDADLLCSVVFKQIPVLLRKLWGAFIVPSLPWRVFCWLINALGLNLQV